LHGSSLSFVALFTQADSVVKTVMILLMLASVWVWAVILETLIRLWQAQRTLVPLEQRHLTDLAHLAARPIGAAQRVLAEGVQSWRQEAADLDSAHRRDHLERVMRVQLGREIRRLDGRLPSLATISSAAPFIGLFGTVWGIMNSFSAIAQAKDTSLATVAPGIAEALLATAMGLVAAIPALIAYNMLATSVGRFSARTQAVLVDTALSLSLRRPEER